jgi:hypothetical protein
MMSDPKYDPNTGPGKKPDDATKDNENHATKQKPAKDKEDEEEEEEVNTK